MMKQFYYKKAFIKQMVLLIVLLFPNLVRAEGTTTLSPNSTIITALSLLPSQNRGSFLGCPEDNRVYFRVNNFNTEHLYFGFNWRNYASAVAFNPAISDVYMRIYDPSGTQVAQINLPSSGTGYINTWTEANIGANVAGSHAGGYDPLSFTPTANGEYYVNFYRSADGGATQLTTTTWSFSPFFDMQIATTAGVRTNGRIHCDKWAFNAMHPTQFYTSFDQDASPTVYAWSVDSCIIKFNFSQEFKPIAFDLSVNNYGVANSGNFSVDRQSTNNVTSPSLTNGYKLFLNTPDALIYPASAPPTNPKLESPIIIGCSSPFKIRYTTHEFGDVRLILDLNGTDGYQVGTSDVILEQSGVSPGLNVMLWNGLDGQGNAVSSGSSFKLVLSYLKGRFNLPVYDAEVNKNGLNVQTIAPFNNANVRVYWDDSQLSNVGTYCDGTAAGAQNNISGAGTANIFVGATSPCHAWSGDGNLAQTIPAPTVGVNESANLQCDDFGNVRTINTFGWGAEVRDSATILFACLQATGTLWNDKDGSANGTNTNVYTAGEVGTTMNTPLYVSLVDPLTGLVLQSVPVNANGTYTFTAVPPNATGLSIVLSSTIGVTDNLPPTEVALAGWQNTSPLTQTFNSGVTNLSGLDFGVRTQDLSPDINQTLVNTPVSGTVATNDNIIPGGTFTQIGNTSNGNLVMNPDGTYTYTPNPDFVGRDSVSYVVCSPSPVVCDTTTLTIVVTPVYSSFGNTVIAQDDHATTPINTAVTMNLLANDSDPNGNTISNPTIIANPANGTVSVNPNGTVLYTPNTGFTGEDVYQYFICDNGTPTACDTAYAYVTIVDNPITNNQTYANDDAYVTNINTPKNGNVSLNDTDPQGDNVTFTQVTNPAHGSVTLNTDGTFTYTPNNGYTGPDQFIYSKCDNGTPTACDTATAYITIHNVQQEANPDINQTLVNTPVPGRVYPNDNVISGSTFTQLGTMSNGILVLTPSGDYTYTPNPDFVGRDSVQYIVCSPAPVNLCDTTTLTIIVTPVYSNFGNTVIAQNDNATTPINTAVTMNLLANDSDPNGNTISNPTIIANPANGTVVVNPNGTVTYTPNNGFTGEDVYQYFICDNGTPTACDTAYAYVTIVDNPITNNQTYANDDAYVTNINTPKNGNVSLNDTDPQGDAVNFTKISGPNHGSVILNSNGTFTYTPNNGYVGPDQFLYIKCDNGTPGACDIATAYITIHDVQQDAVPDINQTLVNTPVSGSVETNDNVIPGSTFTPLGTMSNGTLVLNTDGTYTYTPNTDFVGTDSVQYIVCSPAPVNLCDTTTLTIVVTPVYSSFGNTVIAQDDHATTPINTAVIMNLLANDSDPNGNTIGNPTVISNPAHGTVIVNLDGTVTYTPNNGYTGNDVYQYFICDNGTPTACDTAYAYVTIVDNPITNNQTYANDDAYVTNINTPKNGNVSLNDTDPQGDNVTFTQVTNPSHGSVTLNTDGTFTYTPNNGYTGPDQFIYSKCDNGTPTACDTATAYITIHDVQQDAVPDINQTLVNKPVSGSVETNDNVIPGSTFTQLGTMSNGTLVLNTDGTYTYTPNFDFVGRDSVQYIVCSPAPVNLCDTTTLTITVSPAYKFGTNTVIAQDDHSTTPINRPVDICLLCNDSDPQDNTIGTPVVISNPTNGSVIINIDGTATYIPNTGFTGRDVFTYTICDNGTPVACDTADVYVTIVDNPLSNNQTYSNDDAYVTLMNVAKNGDVSKNDTDPQNDDVTFTQVTNPTHGSVVLDANGTFTYTPNIGYTGPDSYLYSKCDNGSPVACDTATVYITMVNINSPLPVIFGDFNVLENNCIVNVNWSTLEEINVSKFNIERKLNNANFEAIGTVLAKGNTSSKQVYNFVDRAATTGNNEYRLIAVDIDGKSMYSTTESLKLNCIKTGEVSLYPNPAHDNVYLSISSAEQTTFEVKIIDAIGKIVYTTNVEINNNKKVIDIPTYNLSNGIYSIMLNNGTEKQVIKFSKN